MALQTWKFPLHDATFPFISTMNQRSVMVGQMDPAGHLPRNFSGAEDNYDYNTGQLLYAENVVPVAYGLRSTSYVKQLNAVVGLPNTFDRVWSLRDVMEDVSLFAPSKGMNYVYVNESAGWDDWRLPLSGYLYSPSFGTIGTLATGAGLNDPTNAAVTTAYVDGKTIICYSRMKATFGATLVDASLWAWPDDPTATPVLTVIDSTGALATATFTPRSDIVANLPTDFVGAIDGCASVQGYLVLWSGLQIAWAPYNGTAFDFQSYLNGEATGAGVQTPEDLDGPITACVRMPGGFIIFTARNAIAAIYSSANFQQPWIFRQISGAGGVTNIDKVTQVESSASVFAYTSNGLQQITLNTGKSVFPACTDFLGGHVLETYDFDTHELTSAEVTTEFEVKMRLVGNRFLCISYGMYPGIYSFALIYDTVLDRWGKLRKKHVDIFAYSTANVAVDITWGMLLDVTWNDLPNTAWEDMTLPANAVTYPRQLLSTVDVDGEVDLVVMDNRSVTTPGQAVVVLGEIQLVRAKQIEFHQAEIEGGIAITPYIKPTYQDGSTLPPFPLANTFSNGDYKEFAELQEARSWRLQIEGSFNLSTVICRCGNGGSI